MRQPSAIIRCRDAKTAEILGAVRWLGLEFAPPSIIIGAADGTFWLWPVRPELRGRHS